MTPVLWALLLAPQATISLCEQEGGSHPETLRGRDVVEADLKAIPAGTEVYRAVFRPGRDEGGPMAQRLTPVKVTLAGKDEPLPLLPPRFTAIDVTEPVREAVRSGRGKIAFRVAALPGYVPFRNRLEITAAIRPRARLPAPRDLRAVHRSGRTLLTWTDPEPALREEAVTFKEWGERRAEFEPAGREVRFRIYRSTEPVTAETIGRAELVDEVGTLTAWNPEFHGISPKPEALVPRFVVEEGRDPVKPGTGIYAHHPNARGKSYYAVSRAVNGEEDLASWIAASATKEAVEEEVGPGEPVLQRRVTPESFNYVERPTLHYFVRWEAPPRSHLPSRPFDYLVAVPPGMKEPASAGLHLHCWGGSLEGGYGWWSDAGRGALLISTNQSPYDWWTGYHEHEGSWRSWSEGRVRDFTQARVMAFLDWAGTRWKIDRNRVFSAGASMGGSGSPSLALRRADRIAWAVSWVGVHTPARSPQFRGSYERVYGSLEWKLKGPDGETPAFEYFDDAAWVRKDPGRESPLLCFSNGKNDGAIGWPQARDFWKALQETRRPHVFVWGQAGHGQRAFLPGPNPGERELGIDVRLDRTLPAFTNGSLDDRPGGGDPKDGDEHGQSNLHLLWDTSEESVVDRPDRWSMVLRLNTRAPRDECTVDVTPRRCRSFRPAAGTKVRWRQESLDGKGVRTGEVAADAWGLVTVPGVIVREKGTRLTLEVAP